MNAQSRLLRRAIPLLQQFRKHRQPAEVSQRIGACRAGRGGGIALLPVQFFKVANLGVFETGQFRCAPDADGQMLAPCFDHGKDAIKQCGYFRIGGNDFWKCKRTVTVDSSAILTCAACRSISKQFCGHRILLSSKEPVLAWLKTAPGRVDHNPRYHPA
jgi:hypothetical protein